MILESTARVVGEFPSFPQEVVRAERSQGRVPIAEALSGGPVHRRFVEALPAEWQADPGVEIFSRVLWLREGWYPLTPHWHFDWGQGAGGQNGGDARVETLMVLCGDASRTEFVLGPLEVPDPTPDELAELAERAERERERAQGAGRDQRRRRGGGSGGGRRRWDAVVEAGLAAGTLRSWSIEPDRLVLFDDRTLHRARAATRSGWRVLVRAIRGLPPRDVAGDRPHRSDARATKGFANPGRFRTCRNGYIPDTDEARARYQPYADHGPW